MTRPSLAGDAQIRRARDTHRRRLHGLRHDGEVVQALLDEQADDAVRVEQKIAARGVLVADDGVERLKLRGGREGDD